MIERRKIKEWCVFGEDRAYVLMAIARRKHNESLSNSEEIVYRRVLTDGEDISKNYYDLKRLINSHSNLTFRLYLSVNARDIMDAYFNFKSEMETWTRHIYHGDDGSKKNVERLGSKWKSALHNPSTKDDSYFQFDLDDITEEELRVFKQSLAQETSIEFVRKTPNGYHVISEPFDYTKWDEPVEYDDLDTDGQLFVEVIET